MESHTDTIVYITFLIFTGTAIVATLALFTRQSLLVAYMLLGGIFGPYCLKLVDDVSLVKQTSDIGILFLLFLLGLHLQPQNLLSSIRKMSWIALLSSLIFFLMGFSIGEIFHFTTTESIVIGAAMMFSSTIIGLKLLPTTVLHHQHTGELMISILLLQDIIAIIVLLFLQGAMDKGVTFIDVFRVVVAFPSLILFAFVAEKYILVPLLTRFDRIQEYVFLLSIGWCLGMAQFGHTMGLSEEVGAFIGGVALASNPISLYIAECLKPLRDFFLVMFFFSIGAGFDFSYLPQIIIPALILAALALIIKPIVFNGLLSRWGEKKNVSWEVGVRLGQSSEFSLLVVSLAVAANIFGQKASSMVQAATIITFVVSSYWVVLKYPTPVGATEELRRD